MAPLGAVSHRFKGNEGKSYRIFKWNYEDTIHLDIEIVEISIAGLKNETACGEGIKTELIKYGTGKIFYLLRSLFERCLNGEEVP